MKRTGFLWCLTAASLVLGLFPFNAFAQQASVPPSAEEAKRQMDWRISMAQVPLPKKGCFQVGYPAKEWRDVACVATPTYPQPPKRGSRPLVVGNGDDVSAQVPSGFISTTIGSFDSVSGVTSESGPIGNTGPPVANAYTLQINTNFFSSTVCAGSPNPNCQGWQQFVFENTGSFGRAYIQYWLIKYNTTCPAGMGWNQFSFTGSTDIYCWKNNTGGAVPVPNQPITNLGLLSMSGAVSSTSDSVTLAVGGTLYARNGDNAVNAAAGWQIAEFNIVGDGGNSAGGGMASFNAGSTIVPRTRVIYGGTAPPTCVAVGFTAETNNLSFGPSAPPATGPGPAVLFTESSAGGAPSDCAAATSVGDTHLTTVKNLFYDFQAAGDFVVAQVDPDFSVEARQVSGAPTWPDATVNKAVATRMGKTTVALCLAPERLYVDGAAATIPETGVLGLPSGVDITRRGNQYFITSESGDSVSATVHGAPGWIDIAVGFGHWPATVKGLFANANENINQIAASDGFVLNNAFAFDDLYHHYADSWRVSPRTSLLSVCSAETETRAPAKTFYTEALDPQTREKTRATCTAAGVTEAAFLDACTVDVAMIGNDEAAKVFVGMRPPAAVGKIVAATGGGGAAAVGGRYGKYIWWLLLLLILIVIIVWLLRRK